MPSDSGFVFHPRRRWCPVSQTQNGPFSLISAAPRGPKHDSSLGVILQLTKEGCLSAPNTAKGSFFARDTSGNSLATDNFNAGLGVTLRLTLEADFMRILPRHECPRLSQRAFATELQERLNTLL